MFVYVKIRYCIELWLNTVFKDICIDPLQHIYYIISYLILSYLIFIILLFYLLYLFIFTYLFSVLELRYI
jgi:hypothetical protein